MIALPMTSELSSEAATADLALRMGTLLKPGDTLCLEGPIGAGKSFFARALIQSLMTMPEDVPSPTFTLVQTYETAVGEIWHADLYRLGHVDELVELGLDAALGDAICLIEWPDRLGPLWPEDALTLRFEATGPDTRRLTITGAADWAARLAPLSKALV